MTPILFRSTDPGAPVLNNAAGALISVLDACLVTGFNLRGITSVAVASNVCTVTTSTAHLYRVDDLVTNSGLAAPALNGDKVVLSIPTATTFTFAVTLANMTETPGSASVKRTPLGWQKLFTGANKAVYKSTDSQSYGQSLRVDDSAGGFNARVLGVEAPTTVDAYADAFPTEAQFAGGGHWTRGANNSTAKFWAIVGDDRLFYYIAESSAQTGQAYTLANFSHMVAHFGDINSFKNGESFGCTIGACYTASNTAGDSPVAYNGALGISITTNTPAFYIARQHTGIVKSTRAMLNSPGLSPSQVTGEATNPVYPSPVDNGLVFAEPSFVFENLAAFNNPIRGTMPGALQVLCRNADLSNVLGGEVINATDGSGLKALIFKNVMTQNVATRVFAIRLSGVWR